MKGILIDRFGRNINYLRVSITDRCNLRCIYCNPEANIIYKNQQQILTYEEILKIVKVCVDLGITKIRLTGGEPLVRKDVVCLVSLLSKIKGIEDLSLTTNGVFLEAYAKDLKKAGLKRINISLDTLDREKYKFITKFDGLHKVLNGINKSLEIGFYPIKINVVVMKNINEDEIIEFAKLTLKEPLHIRFIEYMPIGCTKDEWEEKFVPYNKIKNYCQSLGVLKEIKIFDNNTAITSYQFENAKGTISFISPVSKPFCDRCSRLRLTSDGNLRSCLFSSQMVDLKKILRNNNVNNQVVYNALKQSIIHAVKIKPKESQILCNNYIYKELTMCQIGG